MDVVYAVVGILVIGVNLIAGAWGGWCWGRGNNAPSFWPLLRCGQAVLIIQILLGGTLVALGHQFSDLHILYGLLPLAVSFIGEQIRISSAESVLTARGIAKDDARDLPVTEQNAVVAAVMRREMGVMAASSLVVAVLALRAAESAGLF